MIFCNKNKQDILNGNISKLDIYFSLKNCFDREKYTQINYFKIHHSPSNYVSWESVLILWELKRLDTIKIDWTDLNVYVNIVPWKR